MVKLPVTVGLFSYGTDLKVMMFYWKTTEATTATHATGRVSVVGTSTIAQSLFQQIIRTQPNL